VKIYLVLHSDLDNEGVFIDSLHETKESAYKRLSKLDYPQQWVSEQETEREE